MALTRGFIRNAVTTPTDARLMDMGQIVCNADGTPRVGVLAGSTIGTPLLTALATMHVAVAAAEFVTSKSKADGVAIFTNDGTVNVPISAAPGSNSRITVIWVKHNDSTTGDGDSLPVFGTTDGAAAGSPTKPAIPTGALELGTLRVYSGTTAANGGSNTLTITNAFTAARGGVVPFRTKTDLDLWTTPVSSQLAVAVDTGTLYIWRSGAWQTEMNPPVHAVMRRTATALQAPNGSYGDLSASAAWTATGGILSGCTYSNGIVVSRAGWYRVYWTLWIDPALPSGVVGIKVNAGTASATTLHALAPIVPNVISTGHGSADVLLAAGDKLTLWGYGNGAVMNIRSNAGGEPMHWGAEWLHA